MLLRCSTACEQCKVFGSRSDYFSSFALVSHSSAVTTSPLTGNLPVRTERRVHSVHSVLVVYPICMVCTVCTVYTQGSECTQERSKVYSVHVDPQSVCTAALYATSSWMCPAWMEQDVPNLTTPRDYQSPGGAEARWEGLQERIFGYRF